MPTCCRAPTAIAATAATQSHGSQAIAAVAAGTGTAQGRGGATVSTVNASFSDNCAGVPITVVSRRFVVFLGGHLWDS